MLKSEREARAVPSGGQESLWRTGFALWLFLHFACVVAPLETNFAPVSSVGMLASVLLALGWHDRPAALVLALTWMLRPGAPDPWRLDWIVALLLVLQFCIPKAPYGSLAVRGRADPGGSWSMPAWVVRLRWSALFACAVFVLFPGDAFVVDVKHTITLAELQPRLVLIGMIAGLLPFLFRERALKYWWLGFLAGAVYVSFETGKQGSREFLWLALAANLQPAWVPALAAAGVEQLFYDGSCALCHGFVRFVLAEDSSGRAFRFAPLESEAFRSAVPASQRAGLPDSTVVRTVDGRILVRSAAVLHVLQRLGGAWRALAWLVWLVPRPLRDLAYDLVASLRKRVFGTKTEACPMLPRHLRARFDG